MISYDLSLITQESYMSIKVIYFKKISFVGKAPTYQFHQDRFKNKNLRLFSMVTKVEIIEYS